MDDLSRGLLRAWVAIAAWTTAPRERDERGDVPGWVMITVMSAGMVAVLAAVIGPQLTDMVSSALAKVR